MKKDEPDDYEENLERHRKFAEWARVRDDPAAAQRFRDAEKNRTQI